MITGTTAIGIASHQNHARGIGPRFKAMVDKAGEQTSSGHLTPDQIRNGLAQAVTDGKLTQSQADDAYVSIVSRPSEEEASETAKTNTNYSPWGRSDRKIGPPEIQAVAEKMGMSVGRLSQELRSGKTLAGIAEDNDVTEQELNEIAAEAARAHLDRAVKAGRIDQSTADDTISRILNGEWLGSLANGNGMKGLKQ